MVEGGFPFLGAGSHCQLGELSQKADLGKGQARWVAEQTCAHHSLPGEGGGLGSWLLRGLIHRCSLSTYCVSGTVPVLRIKGELSEARPSRSSRSGRATRRGLSALAGGAGCYWKHRKGNLPSPGRSGEPPQRKEKQEFISWRRSRGA